MDLVHCCMHNDTKVPEREVSEEREGEGVRVGGGIDCSTVFSLLTHVPYVLCPCLSVIALFLFNVNTKSVSLSHNSRVKIKIFT